MQTLFLLKNSPMSSGTIYASYGYNSGQICFSGRNSGKTLRLDQSAYLCGIKYVEPVRCLQEPQYWQPKETPVPRIDKKSSKLLTKLIGRVE